MKQLKILLTKKVLYDWVKKQIFFKKCFNKGFLFEGGDLSVKISKILKDHHSISKNRYIYI